MSETLLAFKAGRAFRREGTNTVDPSTTKGAVILCTNADDGLLHFQWKNRASNEVEEDLILFPSDAEFAKVTHPDGRVYVLKFSSSDQRHFFWMQDASSARDDEFVNNLNGYLQDPEFLPAWGAPAASDAMSTSVEPVQSSQPQAGSTQLSAHQMNQLQNIISSFRASRGTTQEIEPSLTDILTPANIQPLFTSYPSLIPSLFPHLPPDLPVPPSEDVVRRVINSPQFRAAVSNFDQALRTGLLGGLVRSLGLPEEAGTGVGPFLRAVQEKADREMSEAGMDID